MWGIKLDKFPWSKCFSMKIPLVSSSITDSRLLTKTTKAPVKWIPSKIGCKNRLYVTFTYPLHASWHIRRPQRLSSFLCQLLRPKIVILHSFFLFSTVPLQVVFGLSFLFFWLLLPWLLRAFVYVFLLGNSVAHSYRTTFVRYHFAVLAHWS